MVCMDVRMCVCVGGGEFSCIYLLMHATVYTLGPYGRVSPLRWKYVRWFLWALAIKQTATDHSESTSKYR